jgi:hypothetical protein
MREFVTAVEAQDEELAEKGTPFMVDGVECRCFRPKDGQVAVLMAQTGRHASDEQKVAAIINFFVGVLDDHSYQYLVDRLLDGRDNFGLVQVEQIMSWMIEEWSGHPIQRPSVSTGSRRPGGPNSTQPTLRSISSDSPSTDS